MKWITNLAKKAENILENAPIWIAGSGPSLDEYPDDFLHHKFSIALHLAYLKFPNTTYRYANEYDRVKWFKENRPEYLDKDNIFAFPFYNKTERECNSLIDLDRENYYFLALRPYPKKTSVVRAWHARGVDFGGWGTCLHGALYVALMMHGKPINIIGCNHESKDGLEHFKLANDNNQYRDTSTPYAKKGKLMKEGTEKIINRSKFYTKINWIKSYDEAKKYVT